MKFRLVAQLSSEYPITLLCQTLEVSCSGYYAWKQRPECSRRREDRRLRTHIRAIFQENQATYGSPRIHRELRERGLRCGRKRVCRLMREDRLKPKQVKKFRATTDSNHSLPVAPNLLERQFEVSEPNRVWLGDITYIWTQEGWLYLAALMDLASRRIVGWSTSSRLTQELSQRALTAALQVRRPQPGLLHHTDRGGQYAAKAYQKMLKCRGITCSMSRRGDCWDNSPMESFFHSLKVERVHHRRYRTREEANTDLFEYIESFYNRRRRHSALDYRSPADYEKALVSLRSADNLWKSCEHPMENSAPDLASTLLLKSQDPSRRTTTILV